MRSLDRKAWVIVTVVMFIGSISLAGCVGSGGSEGLGGGFDHPAFGENRIYISGLDGYLYAMDTNFSALSPGGQVGDQGLTLSWREAVGDQVEPEQLIAGPALFNDPENPIVVVGSEDGNLYAYDAVEGGDPLWSFQTGGKIWSTPVIRHGIVYFGSHDKNVYALNVGDGKLKWDRPFATGGAVAGRPLLFQDLLVVGSFDRKLYGLDATTGVKRWEVSGDNWFWAGAVADERTIFAPSMDGNIYAIDSDGRTLWKCNLGSSIVSRPALTSGVLLVAAKSGRGISLLDTDPNSLDTNPKEDCRKRLLDYEFIGDDEIKAPLFVTGNTLYVGTQGSTVVRLDLSPSRAGGLGLDEAWCFETEANFGCE